MLQAPVTRFLVFANVGIHILRLLYYYSVDPYSPQHVERFFGLVPVAFWSGSIWQPVTALFIHSWELQIHIVFNMVSLWSLGQAVERTVGSVRFLLLYMVSGLMSTLFVLVFQHDSAYATVGASGAILGLLGALGVFYPRSTMLIFFIPMRAITAVLLFGAISVGFILYDFLASTHSIFSHIGHLGGLLGGVLYSRLALQLPFLANELQGEKKSRFRVFRPSARAEQDDAVFAAMEELRREREGLRRESEKRDAQAAPAEPFNTPIPDRPAAEHDDRRVYFDPVTGRFYIK